MGIIGRLLKRLLKPHEEQRRDRRQECTLRVDVDCFDRCNCGTMANLSDGGAFVSGYSQAALGDQIRLTVPLGKIEGQIRFEGQVVRSDPAGIGICFSDMAPNHRELIRMCFERPELQQLETIT